MVKMRKYAGQVNGLTKDKKFVYLGLLDEEGTCLEYKMPLSRAMCAGLTKLERDQAFNYFTDDLNCPSNERFELIEGNPMSEEEVEQMVRENRERFKRLR